MHTQERAQARTLQKSGMAFMLVYLCRNDGVQTRMLGAGLFGEKGYSYEDPYIAAAATGNTNALR